MRKYEMTNANVALSSALDDQEIYPISTATQIELTTTAEKLKYLRTQIRELVSKSNDIEFQATMRYELKLLRPIPEALDKHIDLFERAIQHWNTYVKNFEKTLESLLRTA